jgi:hypothetical protein
MPLFRLLGPAPRAELVHVLPLPDFERADGSVSSGAHPETRTFGELLSDPEEDRAARAVVFGLLAEMERWPTPKVTKDCARGVGPSCREPKGGRSRAARR